MTKLAIDRYDRHVPFFDGTVRLPAGLDLDVLQVGQQEDLRDGKGRHRRMLVDGEFEAAETSFSSYVVAKSQGLPFTAIPVFPRRLFSQGQIFVNTDAGIEVPGDLQGKAIGLQSFQTTLAVLAKGDLATDYGVPLESIRWRVHRMDTLATGASRNFDISPLTEGTHLADALAAGDIDALFYSRTPVPASGPTDRIRRLFGDPRAAEMEYVQRHGYWPVMHIVAVKEDAVAADPALPTLLFDAFRSAAEISRDYLQDPNWSQIVWAKYALADEQRAFEQSLWTLGVSSNRKNLEAFLGYTVDQGLTERQLTVDELFHPSVLDT